MASTLEKVYMTEFSDVYTRKKPYSVIKGSLSNQGLMKITRCLSEVFSAKQQPLVDLLHDLDAVLSPNGDITSLYKYFVPIKIFTKGEIIPMRDQNDSLKIEKQIAAGSYGKIFSAKIGKVDCVAKMPIGDASVFKEFTDENLTSAILYCLHDEMKLSLGINFLQPFPKIEKIYKVSPLQSTRSSSHEETFAAVYQKLDMDMWKYIDNGQVANNGDVKLTKILAQLAISLYCLQKSIGFLHGDLHCGNVMLVGHDSNFNINFDFGTPELKGEIISPEYRTYIIDLGMVCVDLSLCSSCEIRKKIPSSRYGDNCSNRSHDLRLFLASLYYTFGDSLPRNFFRFLQRKFQVYDMNVRKIVALERQHDPEFPEWHLFYEHVIDHDNSDFYPEVILKELMREFPESFFVPLEF